MFWQHPKIEEYKEKATLCYSHQDKPKEGDSGTAAAAAEDKICEAAEQIKQHLWQWTPTKQSIL